MENFFKAGKSLFGLTDDYEAYKSSTLHKLHKKIVTVKIVNKKTRELENIKLKFETPKVFTSEMILRLLQSDLDIDVEKKFNQILSFH